MKLEKASALAEIVSSVAIVCTLVYLSVQTQQNTEALMAVSRQAAVQAELDLTSDWLERPELVGMPESSTEDEARFAIWRIKVLRVREFEWFQYQSGILDEATWNSYMAPMAGMFGSERGREILDQYAGSPEFKAYLNQWIDERITP